MCDARELLMEAYRDFSARRLDSVVARMHIDVVWPNGMEGGYVYGHEGVREYWTRQWASLNPHVEPKKIGLYDAGLYVVEVHQVVRDLSGNLLSDSIVFHAYQIRDGLIERMDIE